MVKALEIKPIIHKFNTFEEFLCEFHLNEKDLVLTNEFLYKSFMKELNTKANFIFQEKYGKGEPSDEMIDKIINDAKKYDYNRVIAIGGGSIIDIAKLLVVKDAKSALELFEKKIPIVKEKELIIIPTTCGTGSEVTNITISEIKSKKTKMGLASDELYADYAVLIPEIVKGLPYKFFVTSSVDALIHALESYVSPKSTCFTELFAVKAIELILEGYMEIIEKGPEHRINIIENFVIGSNYAGIAFGNTGVGAVHAMSYPLGGTYHIPHGEANYLMFTEVFETYNRLKPEGKIKNINAILRKILKIGESKNVYEALAEVLDKLLERKPLREYGMKESEIESFTDSVIKSQQRLLINNYVSLSRENMIDIYRKLY
ncbi:4-hydroxybutyrate dehydrogenase [Caminicella sporogenes]|uniref:4-hydroxybutyrate dehydrogenase n=1 Tax=Caminicella sporogenes TaxID=166485 RepID=UPI002FE66874